MFAGAIHRCRLSRSNRFLNKCRRIGGPLAAAPCNAPWHSKDWCHYGHRSDCWRMRTDCRKSKVMPIWGRAISPSAIARPAIMNCRFRAIAGDRGYFGRQRAWPPVAASLEQSPGNGGNQAVNARRRARPAAIGNPQPTLRRRSSHASRGSRRGFAIGPGDRQPAKQAARHCGIASARRANQSSRRRIAAGLRNGLAIDRCGNASDLSRIWQHLGPGEQPRRRSIRKLNRRSKNYRRWCISLRRGIHLPVLQRMTAARYGRMARISSPSSFAKSSERLPSSSVLNRH